ncbi:hypothetical protein ADK35_02205 [Streptomyces viridochromogenes]|uniref:hypothetical protein n=1 Tax=Streptomyces viridochromogenes TaxID=1938 RepID=UPI00069F5B9F|nr:hypothetical protein [Streptomyces viridochromogenes]KOG29523.1 hypothetical protein ADK35_02205 [Streptomyces viridochromogenes]
MIADDQAPYAVEAARDMLNGRWQPSDAEVLLGGTMRERRNKLGAAGMRPAIPWRLRTPWTTQSILWIADCVRITDQVLAEGADSLADSAMARLLCTYADAGRPCLISADRLWQQWQDSPAPVPSYQQVQDHAIAHDLDQKSAWHYLAVEAVERWEDEHLTRDDHDRYHTASVALITPHIVLLAAITGDLEPLASLTDL